MRATGPAAATAIALWLTPTSELRRIDQPTHWAMVAYYALLMALAALHVPAWEKGAGLGIERRLLAGFLAGMPLVYLSSVARAGAAPGWWAIELSGLGLFAWLARASASARWLLPAGLAAHGVWDLAHRGRAPFIADWYTLDCFVVDAGLALYAAGALGSNGARRDDTHE